MILPRDLAEQDAIFWDLIQKCRVSREDRRGQYAKLRRWYLTGAGDSVDPARFNKLYSHVDALSAFIYAQDTTRFALKIPRQHQAALAEHAEVARDVFADRWHDTDADLEFGLAVDWSLVYGCSILKTLAAPDLCQKICEPWQFGVLQEDVSSLDDQEAFVHWYPMPLSQLDRFLTGHPKKEAILKALRPQAISSTGAMASESIPPLGAIVMSQTTPSLVGNVIVGHTSGPYEPQLEEETIELAELWVWDDALMDYRCITSGMAEFTTIWRRPNPTLPGECPFTVVAPFPDPNYFWGQSEVARLVALQQWREVRMGQIDRLLAKQIKRSISATGMTGITEEKLEAMRSSGLFVNSGPMGKFEDMTPAMPPDAFAEIKEIDGMFAESGGLTGPLSAQEMAGVRAGTQVNTMATLASARPRKRALIVEDILEQASTKFFRVLRRKDETPYPLPNGTAFLLAHVPEETRVTVSAHSSTPLYADTVLAKADRLLKAKAIDLPTYVELVDPPMADALRAKARVLQDSMAKQAQQRFEVMAQIQHEKASKKGR